MTTKQIIQDLDAKIRALAAGYDVEVEQERNGLHTIWHFHDPAGGAGIFIDLTASSGKLLYSVNIQMRCVPVADPAGFAEFVADLSLALARNCEKAG